MYAVIRTGGKQYRVQEGDTLRIEKLEAEVGQEVVFDDVLMVGDGAEAKIGSDVSASSVKGIVTNQARDKKVIIFKKRRRKNYVLKKGHRQSFTAVKIGAIGV